MTDIVEFKNQYRWLSNFWEGDPIMAVGMEFATAEHLYQALKTNDAAQIEWVRSSSTPGVAKKRGQKVDMREDWDIVRNDAMTYTVGRKFMGEPKLQDWLLSTGKVRLIEGNTWHDNYFGVCSCDGCVADPEIRGMNALSELLMQVRRTLQTWKCPSEQLLEGLK